MNLRSSELSTQALAKLAKLKENEQKMPGKEDLNETDGTDEFALDAEEMKEPLAASSPGSTVNIFYSHTLH